MKISIIGSGYVGLVTGVCLAEIGHSVICVDIDEKKVDSINKGFSPIYEPGLEDILLKNLKNGKFVASLDFEKSILSSDISIISVGTPFEKGKTNLQYLEKVGRDIGIVLQKKNDYHLIIVKSTVPPETTDNFFIPLLEKNSGKKLGRDFGVGVNPEFLREGSAVSDFLSPDRIIIGSIDKKSLMIMKELYSSFPHVEIMTTNNQTAEMIKYASNCFLASLISFSNEIASICSLMKDIDVKDVMNGLHLDKRINPILSDFSRVNPPILSYLEAGCGFGGSCFPKDVRSMIAFAKLKGKNSQLLDAVIKINEQQPYEIIKLLERHYSSFSNITISILGLSFKPGTDDIRESPAFTIINYLLKNNASLRVYDPSAIENSKPYIKSKNVTFSDNLISAINKTNVIILITAWKEFEEVPNLLSKLQINPLIIDGRRMFDKTVINLYEGIGLTKGICNNGSVF